MALSHCVHREFGKAICFQNPGNLWDMFVGSQSGKEFWEGMQTDFSNGSPEDYFRAYLVEIKYTPESLANDLEETPEDFFEAQDMINLYENLISTMADYLYQDLVGEGILH